LSYEAAANGVLDFDESDWTETTSQHSSMPRQSNGADCGMFVIMVIDSIVNNIPLRETSYKESDLPEYRFKLAKAILHSTLYNNEVDIAFEI